MEWKKKVAINEEDNKVLNKSVKLTGKALKREIANAKRATYAILGLGRYGTAVAKRLADEGVEIICIDKDEKIIQSDANSNNIYHLKTLDVTNIEALKEAKVNTADTVIICMASNLAATVVAIAHCKSLKVKNIIAKAATETEGEILESLGAKAVLPESESGERLAKKLLNPHALDLIEDCGLDIMQIDVDQEWDGKTLESLKLRQKWGYNVVAVKTRFNKPNIDINPKMQLKEGWQLVVIAKRKR